MALARGRLAEAGQLEYAKEFLVDKLGTGWTFLVDKMDTLGGIFGMMTTRVSTHVKGINTPSYSSLYTFYTFCNIPSDLDR